jgi:hypothetical protein
MKNQDKSYFTTKSKVFAISIQFITDKRYYKFEKDNEIIYSFEINNIEKSKFYEKLKRLQEIKFS